MVCVGWVLGTFSVLYMSGIDHKTSAWCSIFQFCSSWPTTAGAADVLCYPNFPLMHIPCCWYLLYHTIFCNHFCLHSALEDDTISFTLAFAPHFLYYVNIRIMIMRPDIVLVRRYLFLFHNIDPKSVLDFGYCNRLWHNLSVAWFARLL